jgi:hypothetical protein
VTPPVRPASRNFAESYLQSIAEVLDGDQRIGLGFFLDELIVVTCSHVVDSAGGDLRIRVPGGERVVRLAGKNPDKDVAFLKLDAPVSGFELCQMDLEAGAIPGTAVQFVGWSQPSGAVGRGTPLLHSDRIQNLASSAMGTTNSPSEIYELSGDCQPGYSGGPVVLEGQGRACGMIVARDPKVARAFAIPGSVLADCYRSLVAETRSTVAPSPCGPPATARRCSPPGGRYCPDQHVANAKVDAKVLELFEGRNPVVLCAPAMYGKIWWLNNLLPQLKSRLGEGGCVATVLAASFGKDRNLKALLLSVIDSLVRSVRGEAKAAREAWDDTLDAQQTSRNCIEDFFFSRLSGEALLILELPDEFWDNPHQGEFLELLRAWTTAQEPWNRLRLLVIYSTTPSAWTGNVADSPFNVLPVIIGDWAEAEIRQAAALHGFDDVTPSSIAGILNLVGGHPYLVRLLLHEAQSQGIPLPRYLQQLASDATDLTPAVERLFARCRLREDKSLQQALFCVWKPQACANSHLEYKQFRRLYDAGLIRGNQSNPSLRAPLFARILFGHG